MDNEDINNLKDADVQSGDNAPALDLYILAELRAIKEELIKLNTK